MNFSSELITRLERHARERPDEIALRQPQRSGSDLTWSGLFQGVRALAGELARRGRPDEAVMLVGANCVATQTAMLGALAAGRDLLVASPSLTPTELSSLISRAKTSLLIADASVRRALHGGESEQIELETLPDLAGSGSSVPSGVAQREGALLLESSGTTGSPKIARRGAPALDALGRHLASALGLSASDRVLMSIPLCHSYGIDVGLLASTWAGASCEFHERFVPQGVLRALLDRQVSVWPAVPVMLDALSHGVREPLNAPSLRAVTSAGSPLPVRIYDQFERKFGLGIGQIYGATEFGTVTYSDPHASTFEPESVGQPLEGVSLRIEPLHTGRAAHNVRIGGEADKGEIFVRAPSMMDGYIDAVSKFDGDGYLGSGDIGKIGPSGVLTLTGRVKLLIDVGGQKVDPIEVEAALCRHPAVAEAIVVPMAYSDTVQRLKAIVVPAADARLSVDELRAFARNHLALHKVPRMIDIRTDVPRSATGKVQRRQLLEIERLGSGGGE